MRVCAIRIRMTADQDHPLLPALHNHLLHHPGVLLLLLRLGVLLLLHLGVLLPRVMIITIVIATAIMATLITTPPLLCAVSCLVEMQELVRLVEVAA